MNSLNQYSRETLKLFAQYVNDKITVDGFISGLLEIQGYHRDWIQDKRGRKLMWYRFHSGDTGATLISEIKEALTSSDTEQANSMRKQLNIACSTQELEIYYS